MRKFKFQFQNFECLQTECCDCNVCVVHDEKPSVKTSLDLLLDRIFSVDPLSGLPANDLAQFMSDKSNPEVREYIRQYLMPYVPRTNTAGLSDDELFSLMPAHGESRSAYSSRLTAFIDNLKVPKTDE